MKKRTWLSIILIIGVLIGNLPMPAPAKAADSTTVKAEDNAAAWLSSNSSRIKSVSLGDWHSAAVTTGGDLYCWGDNAYGQVGNGSTADQSTPVKVLKDVESVSLGWYHSAAVMTGGDLYCWGYNTDGQVGNGSESDQYTPVKVLEDVESVSLGYLHSAAVTTGGDLYCWGSNADGQVGNGSRYNQYTPVKVLEDVESVSLGWYYSAAVTTGGDLYCWGYNTDGQVGNGSESDQYTPVKVNVAMNQSEKKLQCRSFCTVESGHTKPLSVTAYENSLDELKILTQDVTWQSADTSIAAVENIGFILPVSATKYDSDGGSYETWQATGMVYVRGAGEGTTTITGTASDGSEVTCQVTVTRSEESGNDEVEGSGGSLVLGEESSGSADSGMAEFFPASWSLKSSVFPVEISKSENEDGSYSIRGTVGIGKSDWLSKDATWNKYKQNVSDANKYTGRVDCLNSYKDTWKVKSMTAVSTDKFEVLPKLSVMGYFENTYDKNGNFVSGTGKLAADAKWSGSINWQFVTPIGPLYLNLGGSGKLSGNIVPQYDYTHKSLKVADGTLKLTPSVSLEGGYGIDKVATIGAQGTLSVPITIVPASKGEVEAKASLHVKLVFVIDYTHDLATYQKTIWDTTGQKKNTGKTNIVRLEEGKLSEMDTSFADQAGAWNTGAGKKKLKSLGKEIADTITSQMVTLQEGILPSSLPMQAQIAGKNVMVFQSYDNTRETLNSAVLKYSVLENGVWSEPRAILDNGCSDMYADMKVVNDTLVLVWQKEKKEITGDVETDSEAVLKSIAENSEIYFSVFDEATNTFTTPTCVTDNSQYDMMPRICNGSDTIVVSWVRNDTADLMQESGSNTIYTAKWNGASFEEETVLSQASGTIDDYVIYQDTEGIQSVFTGQANGITAVFDTNGQVLSGLSELMTASGDSAISGLDYTDGKINCISKGVLYSYDISGETVTSATAGESAFGSEVKYCSNGEKSGYIWSTYDEETGMGSILASMKTERGYSEPVILCEKENTMWRYFSPVITDGGDWQIVANTMDTESGIHSLLYVTKKKESKLELAGASINEDDVVDGLTGVDYFVKNTEDTTIHNIEIVVTLEDGNKIAKTVPVTLLPGESKAGTAYLDLGEVNETQDVTVSVYAENQIEKSESTITDQIGHSDVSVDAVSSETTDEVKITTTLQNLSSVNADTTLFLYKDEKKTTELQKQDGIVLGKRGSSQVQFTVKKSDITYNENHAAYLTLYATTKDGDYNEDNNTAYIMLYESANPDDPVVPTQKPTDTPPTTAPTKEPTGSRPSASPHPSVTTAPSGHSAVKAGQVVTVKKLKYKVTKVNKNGTGEVALTGTVRKKSDKKFTALKIGNTIKIKGKSFKITAIGKNAFKGYKKLKKVTVGKNVKSIGAKAFYGCKKLKSITIKTKKLTAKKVGSKALKGIYPKAVIKVPKKKVKSYKKLLRSRGAGRKVKIRN